ncbi:MAG: nucleotidyltransferase family protein [Bacteroidales bacterium]|nr:nucleotidyltransferase family protein [Candidatus Physcocola equi]
MNELFFELLRVAIGTQEGLSRQPNADEWEELYMMAKKQSVIGICFAGVQKTISRSALKGEDFSAIGMNEKLYLTWLGKTTRIQQRNKTIWDQCVALQKKFAADGFRSCILKGAGVAALYRSEEPNPETDLSLLRQSGDIDIWLDSTQDETLHYVMKICPTDDFDEKHIHFHCFKNTDVEVHWIPVKWENPISNRIIKKYMGQVRNAQFANICGDLCLPTTTFQTVHQLMHVFRHYVYLGVGMRQLMDLYFAQRACIEGENSTTAVHEITALFTQLRLMRFVAGTQWVLGKVMDLPKAQMICEPDEREGRELLEEMLQGGNFGQFSKEICVEEEPFVRRFFSRWSRKLRFFRYDPLGALVMPFTRLRLEIWMRWKRFAMKY